MRWTAFASGLRTRGPDERLGHRHRRLRRRDLYQRLGKGSNFEIWTLHSSKITVAKPTHNRVSLAPMGWPMRRILSAISIIAVALALSGCAAQVNRMMASWEGHHFSDLIEKWGPPQQVFEDGSGGRIFIYAANRTWVTPGYSTTHTTGLATAYNNQIWGSANSYTTYTPAQVNGYTAYRMFWISSTGIIYRWSWRGL